MSLIHTHSPLASEKKLEIFFLFSNKKISKLGWLGWSLANKFKKDFPPKYNLSKNAINEAIDDEVDISRHRKKISEKNISFALNLCNS